MTRIEGLTWLDRLKNSQDKTIREMAYNRLLELLSLLLPED
jgi:hypothetical protein